MLPLLKTDLAEIAEAVIDRRLRSKGGAKPRRLLWCGAGIGRIPGSYATGLPIQGWTT